MSAVRFADIVHQSIAFSREVPSQALVLRLIDNRWVQRLRDISQTANTRLVYMFSEHSRFGHSLGVAHLATLLLDRLERSHPEQVKRYRCAVSAAALLHDIGHLAPGSHTAFKSWFPDSPDDHEEVAVRIISEDAELGAILAEFGAQVESDLAQILQESAALPAWTWQIISGGGWNVDRGNWCVVDSILAGVSYGHYNIPALTESIVIAEDGSLGLKENRLDAMVHFAVSRHAMYRQIYQHRVLLAADTLNIGIVQRARDLLAQSSLGFCDEHMQTALRAKRSADLPLQTVFNMREGWWRYHLLRWQEGSDPILADLCSRLLNRKLFKTVRLPNENQALDLHRAAKAAVIKAGYDPRYYLHTITTTDMHEGDHRKSMPVIYDNGAIRPVTEADPLLNALLGPARLIKNSWLVMPAEAKKELGLLR